MTENRKRCPVILRGPFNMECLVVARYQIMWKAAPLETIFVCGTHRNMYLRAGWKERMYWDGKDWIEKV